MKPYYPNFGSQKEIIPGGYVSDVRVPIHKASALQVMESIIGKKHWCVIDGDRYSCFMSRAAALHYCEDRLQLSYTNSSTTKPRFLK